MSGWGRDLATLWTNCVPPSRPSYAEMWIYTNYLNKLRRFFNPVKLLVLGSTPEFRDWGYDENLEISVIDQSKDYYEVISRELRHKNLQETLFISKWEEMTFPHKFDIIIGDLAIGNIQPEMFDVFLENVKNALSQFGLFMGKSFLWKDDEQIKTPAQIIREYNDSEKVHPYTFINHQLGLYCLNKESNLINFGQMYCELETLHKSGELDSVVYSFFQNLGWNAEMNFSFFAPSQEFFIEHVNKKLNFVKFEFPVEKYVNVFPIYIVTQKGGYSL